ncbi:Fe-S cluster assembly protein SufD [Actinomycetospora cinnamomea]|uniref:Iron-regulated ABC transporter permease protein SufD n=1 Tax=Actinomycetospora cinnamomea TaxID=663609 RepID=A0A2U1FHU6_9PSEU|nr:Fe-S cluster assembly protein SufD [Actinomycetospora cinnamomea]PVZ11745.1 iron-regulated ABC transporter permease protein SufD [Actinomycetospora cinnamomea]
MTAEETGPVASSGGGVIDAPGSPVLDVDPGIASASPKTAPWEERHTSYDVEAFEVPRGREEQWRFTPLRRLRGLHDGSATATGRVDVTVRAGFGDSAEDDLTGSGVRVETVGRDDARLGDGGIPADRVAAQAWSSFTEAHVVTINEARSDDAPLTVTVTGPGEGRVAFAHVQLRLERHAEAVVVLDHRGSGTVAANTELVVSDGAKLLVVEVHDWADDAVYVGAQHLSVGRDATIRHTSVTLGGDLVRLSPVINYREPGGDVELDGLYFADGGQHFEQRLLVDHSIPHCRSRVTYKGALQGAVDSAGGTAAHTVWIGDVLIRKAAEGTDTYELNRNLLLTDNARADSVPNLEIETGEIVGAGHASATGRFDDEQLFYLMARGIPEAQARRLVVRGFFGEVIQKIRVPALRDRLEAAIEAELEAVGA